MGVMRNTEKVRDMLERQETRTNAQISLGVVRYIYR